MSKFLRLLLVCALIFSRTVFADEVITDFDKDKSLPVLNEELRKIQSQIQNLQNPEEFVPTVANALAGSVVQVVYQAVTASSAPTGTIPFDDSKPAITEGNEVITASITPTSATNKLLIFAVIHATESTNTGTALAACLFETTTSATDALNCSSKDQPALTVADPIPLIHYMTAPGTGTYTFRVRAGCDTGPITINGGGGNRYYGGALTTSLVIIEIKV